MKTDAAVRAETRVWLAQPCLALWKREMVRFLRQRSRVIGALGTPVVFWILVGSGLGNSFAPSGTAGGSRMSYLEYSFPGALASILLFTAIFATISVIDDRHAGFLQGVLVAPASRLSIVLGKCAGATTLAVGQAAVFLPAALLTGIHLGAASIVTSLLAMTLVAFSMTSLGLWMAWRMETTQGFHAVMNLVLLPMLVLSGAFFPAAGSAKWLRWIVAANPVTYGVSLIRRAMYLNSDATFSIPRPSGWLIDLAVSLVFALVMFGAAVRVVTREAGRVSQ